MLQDCNSLFCFNLFRDMIRFSHEEVHLLFLLDTVKEEVFMLSMTLEPLIPLILVNYQFRSWIMVSYIAAPKYLELNQSQSVECAFMHPKCYRTAVFLGQIRHLIM